MKQASHADEKTIINWLKGTYAAALNESNLSFENPPVSALTFASLLNQVVEQKITNKIAKQVFAKLWSGEGTVDEIIQKEGYDKSSNAGELESLIQAIVNQYPQQAVDYRAGKDKLFAFFVGQVMKQTKGQADPQQITLLLKKYLA